MKTWKKIIIGTVVFAMVGGGVFVYASSGAQTSVNPNEGAATVTLEKTDISKTVSASGSVESMETTNIYSAQSYPVQEILVAEGGSVKAGDVLARLDMSKLENEIAQAELNLLSAEASAEEEQRSNANGVSTAEINLETSQISLERQRQTTANAEADLREAEADMSEPFDSYTYDKAIEDARITLERRETELQTAVENLNDVTADGFDAYTYQNAVDEAAVTLERSQADLAAAEADLEEEKENQETFDAYTYQNAINDAQKTYERKAQETVTANEALLEAQNAQYQAYSTEEWEAAQQNIDTAQTALDKARQAEEDARLALQRAGDDKTRAEKEFNETNEDSKSAALESLEKAVTNAAEQAADAQRKYDKAQEDLTRAAEDEAENTDAEDAVTAAQNNLTDAQRAYDNAVTEKERALEDHSETGESNLESMQNTYKDSVKQLESAQNSVASSENSLAQANGKTDSSLTNVEIKKLALEELNSQLKEGVITATADGTVTEVNTKVGATPSGAMFVIENPDDLYVSANVKEYTLAEIAVGQKAYISTEATGGEVYEAELSYISPKAVTESGSNSVEFEIRAEFDGGDAVRIGMNAFVDVVTESKNDVYSVPLSAIETDESGSVVYSPNGAERIKIQVEVGVQTATQAEISGSGLYDGLVILSQPNVSSEADTAAQGFGMMGGR